MVRKFISKIKSWFTLSQANKERMTIVSLLAVIFVCVWSIISMGNWLFDALKGPDYPDNNSQITVIDSINVNETHCRDAYVHRLESKYDAAREALAIEVDKYINTVAPNADIDALNLIDLCGEYNVDLRLALAQGHVESHFGTKGTAARTNSIFNVGAYDGYSAAKQIMNGYGYKHPDYSVEPYLRLLTTRYLVDGTTEEDLLENFVDSAGHRYASCTTYESMLKSKWDKMDSIANITEAYEVYKRYKRKLGR
jgi:hypothetical protein